MNGQTPPRIVDAVFGMREPTWAWARPVAIVVACAVHGGLLWLAANAEPSLGIWALHLRDHVRTELAREQTVELLPPPPPPEEAKEEPPPPPPPAPRATPRAVAKAPPPPAPEPKAAEPPPSSPEPPAPAQAGAIVAQEETADAPVDFTDNTFVTGKATTYAGGVTASTGTNTVAVKTRQVVRNGAVGVGTAARPAPRPAPPAPDLSTPVTLTDDDWSCPWPREADREQIDEQTAIVQVRVSAAGQVTQVNVLQDPGFGFGRAAMACAYKAHFSPARDRAGRPVDASSPPIRVHFFR